LVEILRYLADHCAYLFEPGRFRIVDSEVDPSFGGNAALVLESKILRLQFTNDRRKLQLEFQAVDGKPNDWFSPGLLRGALEGHRGGSEILTPEWARYLDVALEELEARLSDPARRDGMIEAMKAQARIRARDLFG
jgi:hypothetical protein